MTLDDCLPPDLRGPATTITPIAAGLSGAGVYRVERDGRAFVLKVAGPAEDGGDWRARSRFSGWLRTRGSRPPSFTSMRRGARS